MIMEPNYLSPVERTGRRDESARPGPALCALWRPYVPPLIWPALGGAWSKQVAEGEHQRPALKVS